MILHITKLYMRYSAHISHWTQDKKDFRFRFVWNELICIL